MGFRKSWKKSIRKLGADLQQDRKRLLCDKDEVTLHQFRVRMKQYRACHRWISFLCGESKIKKVWKSLRLAYRKSSTIRDVHVLLQSSSMDVAASKSVKNQLHPSLNSFYRSLTKVSAQSIYLLTENLCLKLSVFSGPALRLVLYAYILTRLEGIRCKTLSLPNDHNLHRIRREIKEIAFLLALWISAEPNTAALQIVRLQLSQKQELLGDWHDQLTKLTMIQDLNVSPSSLKQERRIYIQLEQRAIQCLDDLDHLIAALEEVMRYEGKRE